MIKLLCIIEAHDADTIEEANNVLDNFRESLSMQEDYGVTIYQATPEDLAALKPARRHRPRRTEPVIHFAARQDAEERIHMGPSLCGSGTPGREGTKNAQYVTGIFDNVTCKSCVRSVRVENRDNP